MNLVFAPFVSPSIVRVLPEAHPTMAMRVTRPTRLAISDGAYPLYSGSPGYGGHHSGDEPPKIGFALTLRQGPPATVSSVGGLWRSVALGGDRSAGAGTVQCDFFCSVGLDNAQATPHFPAQHHVPTRQRSQQPTP